MILSGKKELWFLSFWFRLLIPLYQRWCEGFISYHLGEYHSGYSHLHHWRSHYLRAPHPILALVAKLIHKQKQTNKKGSGRSLWDLLVLGTSQSDWDTTWTGCAQVNDIILQHHLLLELSTNPCVNSFVKFDLCCVESLHKTGAEL